MALVCGLSHCHWRVDTISRWPPSNQRTLVLQLAWRFFYCSLTEILSFSICQAKRCDLASWLFTFAIVQNVLYFSSLNQSHHNVRYPSGTTRWINVGLTLVHRLRRWTNAKPTLIQQFVSAGCDVVCNLKFFSVRLVIFFYGIPVNTKHLYDIYAMSDQRRRTNK